MSKICPACNSNANKLIDWEFSGLDDSVFNYTAEFFECPNCGLVFNGNINDEKLGLFYKNECSYFERAHFDIEDPSNVKKFEFYSRIIDKLQLKNSNIADIGCGRGGFVTWLKKFKGIDCKGVDIDVKSLPSYNEEGMPEFIEGSVLALPFETASQSLLTYFHVLEHILNVDKLLSEANKALSDDGYLMVEVPNPEKYSEMEISIGFWPSIREHVMHYSKNAFKSAFTRNGFLVEEIIESVLPTPEFNYQSLIIIGKKCSEKNEINYDDNSKIGNFFLDSHKKLLDNAQRIVEISKKYKTTVFWGVSNQLLSFLPLVKDKINDIELCDMSKNKQKSKVLDIIIESPDDCTKEQSCLVVSSMLHEKNIIDSAIKLGWKQNDIYNLV